MSSSHIRLRCSTARAKRIASGTVQPGPQSSARPTSSPSTSFIASTQAMKEVLGDEVGLALDCGPGWTVPDAIRFARAVEHLNLMWLEDMITGDYVPYV